MRIFKWFHKKIDNYVIKRFKAILPAGVITELYRMVVKRDLLIDIRQVNVKKGKRKYTLLIVKDRKLETVFNLGRYDENIQDEEYFNAFKNYFANANKTFECLHNLVNAVSGDTLENLDIALIDAKAAIKNPNT